MTRSEPTRRDYVKCGGTVLGGGLLAGCAGGAAPTRRPTLLRRLRRLNGVPNRRRRRPRTSLTASPSNQWERCHSRQCHRRGSQKTPAGPIWASHRPDQPRAVVPARRTSRARPYRARDLTTRSGRFSRRAKELNPPKSTPVTHDPNSRTHPELGPVGCRGDARTRRPVLWEHQFLDVLLA